MLFFLWFDERKRITENKEKLWTMILFFIKQNKTEKQSESPNLFSIDAYLVHPYDEIQHNFDINSS